MKLLVDQVKNSAKTHSLCNALWVNGQSYSYAVLFKAAQRLASQMASLAPKQSRCAIYTGRNHSAIISILGAIFAGQIYMPINPKYPMPRNLKMFEQGEPEIICIDDRDVTAATKMLKNLPEKKIIVFHQQDYLIFKESVPKHQYFLFDEYLGDERALSVDISAEDYVYLMFTSGSTGAPKGIAVNHKNFSSYVQTMQKLYSPDPSDRFSHLSEFTFDLSVHDMFLAWVSGACVYIIPDSYIFGIHNFIRDHKLTFWFSVPSTVNLLTQMGHLNAAAFPSLKQSFFCGEALFKEQAEIWQKAAPGSSIINLYGPTEATVAFTRFHWKKDCDDNEPVVSIGEPLLEQEVVLVASNGEPADLGEICLAGSQVVDGYWQNPELTNECFVKYPWDSQSRVWYRTGDIAKKGEDGRYHFLGRIDDQWQIRGYRVEKLAVENELKKIAGTQLVAVLPIKSELGNVVGMVAFVAEALLDTVAILKKARQELPDIMIPQRMIAVDRLPLNSNGKTDYKALNKQLCAA